MEAQLYHIHTSISCGSTHQLFGFLLRSDAINLDPSHIKQDLCLDARSHDIASGICHVVCMHILHKHEVCLFHIMVWPLKVMYNM